ncbi:MAG: GIY-YIG nuclease family protein [Chitinophagales bacterium]|nr:GIY-YIG nuclease family protein [Chitinophagales bacterium]MCB9031335.1 GIY-YIG nuclease family protein [Chitinophagales bacterium]HAE14784.1 endonuclease [Bacteroidota bacterium]
MPVVFVYALKNDLNSEVYVGMTSELDRRLQEHNKGKNRYTKAFRPWKIFFSESHPDFISARVREKYLKTASGKNWLKKQPGFLS